MSPCASQSLRGLAHYDFNLPGAYSYEQSMQVIRKLGLSTGTVEQQFRRMAFNIVARNQDDHVKNVAFLMNKQGAWWLAPAYDLTYSYNPRGAWTSRHQMTLNGKREDFSVEDFKACGRTLSLKRARAEQLLREVVEPVARWNDYADEVGVPAVMRDEIANNLRLEGWQVLFDATDNSK
ncbi:MAG: HipA domain-containing protein [Candidatus Thiodiazotropha sp.]